MSMKKDRDLFQQGLDLARKNATVSDTRAVLDFFLFFGLLSGVYSLLLMTDFHWVTCILAFIVVAKVQNGLLLSSHEASHDLLFSNKRLNDWFGEYICSASFGFGYRRAKAAHMDHHKYLLSVRDHKIDQQIETPTLRRYLAHIFKPLLGSYLLKFLARHLGINVKSRAETEFTYTPEMAKADARGIILIQLALFIVLTALDWRLYIFFWALPVVTLTAFFHNAKGFLDHAALPDESTGKLYSYNVTWLDRLFFGTQQAYHAEHHYYPWVPYYRLKNLRGIIEKMPDVRIRKGYFDFLLGYGRMMRRENA